MSPRTLPGLLEARRSASPDVAAFFMQDSAKQWQPVTWEQFAQKVGRTARALNEAGLRRGDRVGILAPTSLDWEYAQMGALAARAVVAGIDPAYPSDQRDLVIRLLNPSVLFVQDRAALDKIPKDIRAHIKLVVIFEGMTRSVTERSMQDIIAVRENDVETTAGPEARDAAVMVFSSGTTGSPKAIVFSHEQVRDAIDAIIETFDDVEEGTILLCWLPLANLFQRVINFFAIARGAKTYILRDPRELMDGITSVEPHILIGVPRVFARVQAGIAERIAQLPVPIRQLVQWSLRLGCERAQANISGKHMSLMATFCWHLADKLILARLRRIFGKRMRYFISGSAAMPVWLLEWFEGIGLPILEAYGVSENIIPVSANRLSLRKLGTVGKSLSSNRIALAPDGEILVRGPGVFHGYWDGQSVGGGCFTADGYLCTGDLGRMDEEGFLTLVGRKSEAFKTSRGKWVSPVRVEERLGRITYIEQAVILALGSDTVAAILSVDKAKFMRYAGRYSEEEKSRDEHFNGMDEDILQADAEIALKELPAYERPVGIIVTFDPFSITGGELTTNLKLRRNVVISRFAFHLRRLESIIVDMQASQEHGKNHRAHKPVILLT